MLKSIEGNFDHPKVNQLLEKHFIEFHLIQLQNQILGLEVHLYF